MPVTIRRSAPRLASAALVSLLVAAPALAAPPPGTWHGKLDKYTSKLHFTVKGKRVLKFTVPSAPAYCLTGFSAISVVVPSATIRGSKLSGTTKVTSDGETETIVLTGHFSASTAKGSVKLQGPCDGTFSWTAHR
jgi:hypothetical protein